MILEPEEFKGSNVSHKKLHPPRSNNEVAENVFAPVLEVEIASERDIADINRSDLVTSPNLPLSDEKVMGEENS